MSRRDVRSAMRNSHPRRKKWSNKKRKGRRELGQNFLKDKRVARRIVEESYQVRLYNGTLCQRL
jgi:hypothetical protein